MAFAPDQSRDTSISADAMQRSALSTGAKLYVPGLGAVGRPRLSSKAKAFVPRAPLWAAPVPSQVTPAAACLIPAPQGQNFADAFSDSDSEWTPLKRPVRFNAAKSTEDDAESTSASASEESQDGSVRGPLEYLQEASKKEL